MKSNEEQKRVKRTNLNFSFQRPLLKRANSQLCMIIINYHLLDDESFQLLNGNYQLLNGSYQLLNGSYQLSNWSNWLLNGSYQLLNGSYQLLIAI